MAKKEEGPALVEARVLIAGAYGPINSVVTVPADEAKESGDLDPHPDAVAYAKSLIVPAAE